MLRQNWVPWHQFCHIGIPLCDRKHCSLYICLKNVIIIQRIMSINDGKQVTCASGWYNCNTIAISGPCAAEKSTGHDHGSVSQNPPSQVQIHGVIILHHVAQQHVSDLTRIALAPCRQQNPDGLPHTALLVSLHFVFYNRWSDICQQWHLTKDMSHTELNNEFGWILAMFLDI